MRRIKTVCVFCGSNPGTEPAYLEAATETGKYLAGNDIGLVFGGGRVGLMGCVADTVMAEGGTVTGVIPKDLAEKEVAHQNLSELHIVSSMHKRKALMAKLSDGFIAMPGGFGTFEEICEVITWTQLGFQEKPCGILNTAGYYDSLISLFDNATEKGFIRPEHRRLVLVSDRIADLVDQLNSFEPSRFGEMDRQGLNLMKAEADLILSNASEVVTCASGGSAKKGASMLEVGRLENASVAVVDGKIAAVAPASDIEEKYEAEKTIDAAGRSIVPGFVESHSHIVYAGNRVGEFELRIKGADYLEILEAGGGILSTVEKTRAASEEMIFEQSKKRLDKLMAGGVTTCEIKTGYGLDTETELKMLRVIARLEREHAIDVIPTFLPAHAVPPEWKGKEDEFTELICREMIPAAASLLDSELRGQSPASEGPFFIDVFCEKGAFTLEQCKRVLLAANELGFAIKAHVDEFTNLGCARFAIENGAVSIDHLDATSSEEIDLLAGSNTVGIVTPTVNFNFGAVEFADARTMIDAGCSVAVSTDYNPGSAPCPSLQTAMAIACRYQKLLPSEALNAVTINAAAAVGRQATKGSIEIGKQADILILDTNDYREMSYEFGWNFVGTVIKDGRVIGN